MVIVIMSRCRSERARLRHIGGLNPWLNGRLPLYQTVRVNILRDEGDDLDFCICPLLLINTLTKVLTLPLYPTVQVNILRDEGEEDLFLDLFFCRTFFASQAVSFLKWPQRKKLWLWKSHLPFLYIGGCLGHIHICIICQEDICVVSLIPLLGTGPDWTYMNYMPVECIAYIISSVSLVRRLGTGPDPPTTHTEKAMAAHLSPFFGLQQMKTWLRLTEFGLGKHWINPPNSSTADHRE